MNITFTQSAPRGTVTAPPSKSCAHRLLLCAALSDGESTIENISLSQDVAATVDCLRALGVTFDFSRGSGQRPPAICVRGFDPFAAASATLPCRESASTLRFLLPLCQLSGNPMTFTGSPRLFTRPLDVYESLCRERGLCFARAESTLTVQGTLRPGAFTLPGNVSSQFVSGLLFALPLLPGDSSLTVQPPVVSRPYTELTLQILSKFGIYVDKKTDDFYVIPGNQHYIAKKETVEGDWSNAAPFLALRALGFDVSVSGLAPASVQGDRCCPELLARLRQGYAHIDLADCPDLAPVLFAAAALLHGGRFTHTRRLREKESDRVAAMQQELQACGALVRAEEDAVTVLPAQLHAPDLPLACHNDHRVAMALSLVLNQTGGTLAGAECVEKSYPAFFDDLRSLGVSLRRQPLRSE